MTTMNDIERIVEIVRSLSNRQEKEDYLKSLDRDILNFIGGNITKEGIAKAIASEIPSFDNSISDINSIKLIFELASAQKRRKDKIRLMHTILLNESDRELLLTILYGSLKLGIKIPQPIPEFGEIIKPMLCGTKEFDPDKTIIEEKFDGIRCVASNNGGIISLQSRNGKILDVPIIAHQLSNVLLDGITVDGEILDPSGDFQKLDRKSDNLIYQIFDIIFFNRESVTDLSWYDRRNILENLTFNNTIRLSKILDLNSMDEIESFINETGSEGIVAKNPNSSYKYDDRKDWQKFKLFQDISGKVIGYIPGEGRRGGSIGAIHVRPNGLSKITKVGSGFNDNDLDHMKELIDSGKDIIVDIKYQNLTNDGCLRFPIFLRIRSVDGEEI